MEKTVPFGTEDIRFRIEAGRLVACRRKGSPEPAADPAALIRDALEAPQHFPPLRLALTPDDRVALLVDLDRPDVEPLVRPILQHIESAGVAPAHITVIVPPGRTINLPGVLVEEHDPDSREALAYVATTAAGRRVYLNRTFAEADQAVVLSEVRHDPRGGVTGGASSIFPTLSDAATRAELLGDGTSRHAEEVSEIGWLVGLPFFVHVIAGPGTSTARVIAGPAESHRAARTALRDLWVGTVDRLADIAIATLTGDPARHTTGELAAALAHAALAVDDGGVLVLLTDAAPDLGEG
ncbi:MAG: lactate racemase domain-containing protein, partial [Gemmataceae bacterium]|nr:lactate racemase domain-containing protein [Gemmataceae bacterium]